MEVPTAGSVGNKVVCMRLIYLFELKTLAVLYLHDHEAYTSTVYRPHGCNSSFGMILKKLAGFAMLYLSENDLRCRDSRLEA